MSEAGWIALIAIVATLISGFGGVLLGNWLQSKSAKRQREQQLEDEKRERERALRNQNLDTITRALNIHWTNVINEALSMSPGSPTRITQEDLKEMVTEGVKSLPALAAIGDEKLSDLVLGFLDAGKEVLEPFLKDPAHLESREALRPNLEKLGRTAIAINQRINELQAA